uniref:Uncharacterized protein n=1 Tax=Rousettus aegyptiacus TaxID=9407 RepID=A0A7J8F160_ROUAE|nr:hypothetical protein HJG63_012301 [Rousettus aegyptiacus]
MLHPAMHGLLNPWGPPGSISTAKLLSLLLLTLHLSPSNPVIAPTQPQATPPVHWHFFLCQSHREDNTLLSWWRSTLITLIAPILGPVLLLCILLIIVPCVLRFIQECIREVSWIMVNQLLLHPYARFPTEVPASDPQPICPWSAGSS